MSNLKKILEYIEENVDVQQREKVKKGVIKALNFENEKPIATDAGISKPFKHLPYKETFYDMRAMLYNQLVPIANNIGADDYMVYSIRANYGTGILPSLFGAQNRLVDDYSMPWCEHLSMLQVEECIEQGVPNLNMGLGGKVMETYEYYSEVLNGYPNAKDAIALYHPDLQGPFDVAHLLFGSEIYLKLYDDCELVHRLLSLVTETYIAFMRKYLSLFGNEFDGYCHHWGTIHKGNIVIRNDSAVNLSLDMYKTFVKPYDNELSREFGGVAMHYCGKDEVWLPDMIQNADISGINFGFVPGNEYGIPFLKYVMSLAKEKKVPVVGYGLTKQELDTIKDTDLIQGVTFAA
ncbi:MAG: hypothetical protein M0R40_10065 [Firmicutes bacterium]|nr:hypothetical protein [Bacillota bacterium]